MTFACLLPCYTAAYRTSECQRMNLLCFKFARGTLGTGCIRFKHGRIHWHTLAYGEAEILFKFALKFCAYSDVWFIR